MVLVGGGGPARLAVRECRRSVGGFLLQFVLFPKDVGIGAALMVALGLLAGLPPAFGAMRLKITDALRRG